MPDNVLDISYRSIILWRHADAILLDHNIHSDLERPLSKKGLKQAEKMAYWLKRYLPKNTVIISSKALRAQQTADALKRDYTAYAPIAPEASLLAVLNTLNVIALEQAHIEHLLIVGHQPWLGLLAAQLLTLPNSLSTSAREISIKKGAVWWFKRVHPETEQAFKLLTVQSTHLL